MNKYRDKQIQLTSEKLTQMTAYKKADKMKNQRHLALS